MVVMVVVLLYWGWAGITDVTLIEPDCLKTSLLYHWHWHGCWQMARWQWQQLWPG